MRLLLTSSAALMACSPPGAVTPTQRPVESEPCPITTPRASTEVPPEIGMTDGRDLYGNEALWVALPANGEFTPVAGAPPARKFMWWRLVEGALSIDGQLLSAPNVKAIAEIPSGYGAIGFQATGIEFPQPGCWEVVGRVANSELRFVIRVRSPS